MFVCVICGAVSSDDAESERHFDQVHLGRNDEEDPIWVDYAKAELQAEVLVR